MRFIPVLIIIVFGMMFHSCNQSDGEKDLSSDLINNPITADNSSTKGLPVFKFKKTEHDFGNIIDGVKVAYKFVFTNVGEADLIIHQVKTTCGCTVSRYPKEPIKPGESNFIELTFDSSRRIGFNHKSATVVANTQPNVITLGIKAIVVKEE